LLGVVHDESVQSEQFLGLTVNSGNLAEVVVSGDAFAVDDLMMSATLNFDANSDDDVDGADLAEFGISISNGEAGADELAESQRALARRCRETESGTKSQDLRGLILIPDRLLPNSRSSIR
jgi:hypothetical protein